MTAATQSSEQRRAAVPSTNEMTGPARGAPSFWSSGSDDETGSVAAMGCLGQGSGTQSDADGPVQMDR
jgi:hypothetical protein